jgi:hypothetical protein
VPVARPSSLAQSVPCQIQRDRFYLRRLQIRSRRHLVRRPGRNSASNGNMIFKIVDRFRRIRTRQPVLRASDGLATRSFQLVGSARVYVRYWHQSAMNVGPPGVGYVPMTGPSATRSRLPPMTLRPPKTTVRMLLRRPLPGCSQWRTRRLPAMYDSLGGMPWPHRRDRAPAAPRPDPS